MKNLILTILCAFMLGNLATSQSSIILGVEGGANFTKLNYTGDFAYSGQKNSRLFGYQGGVKVGVAFGGFSILSGVYYNALGGKDIIERNDPSNPWVFETFVDIGKRTATTKFNTLKFPILLRYEFGDKIKFSVAAGMSIHSGLGDITEESSYELTVNGNQGPFESKYTFGDIGSDLFKKSFVAFHFSPGVMYQLSDNGVLTFNLAIESSGGLRNENYVVINNEGQVYNPNGSIKMNSMMFQIGYEHRLNFNVGSKY